jgi:hypothetical protein
MYKSIYIVFKRFEVFDASIFKKCSLFTKIFPTFYPTFFLEFCPTFIPTFSRRVIGRPDLSILHLCILQFAEMCLWIWSARLGGPATRNASEEVCLHPLCGDPPVPSVSLAKH